ncbi:hypothetical protein M427DRAFT_57252 [Gonapodya prolifera JEL478]|uniref:mRNA decay factor PAT1 domain-containing protein n=1 Tax=Gonapodya prolifera (strain JEL478) TaxID=1344416 RepID=A0A139ADK4_GONPJ|nr:hypothetical protein M427DRAFT_57252 [Gonapodya prolifera JEL478]|eukprot:KXS14850.1 hypothetical protein M427DRAFT_57252 [Gonapodya prolifera JEL478]
MSRTPGSPGFFGFDPSQPPKPTSAEKGKARGGDVEVDFENFNSGLWNADEEDALYGELGGDLEEDLTALQDEIELLDADAAVFEGNERLRGNQQGIDEHWTSVPHLPQSRRQPRLGNLIDPDNQGLNQETFDVGKEQIGKDFDFTAANAHFSRRMDEEQRTTCSPFPSNPRGNELRPDRQNVSPYSVPVPSRSQPMSAAEVEAQLLANSAIQPSLMPQGLPLQNTPQSVPLPPLPPPHLLPPIVREHLATVARQVTGMPPHVQHQIFSIELQRAMAAYTATAGSHVTEGIAPIREPGWPASPPNQPRKMLSVEEVEAQMRAQHMREAAMNVLPQAEPSVLPHPEYRDSRQTQTVSESHSTPHTQRSSGRDLSPQQLTVDRNDQSFPSLASATAVQPREKVSSHAPPSHGGRHVGANNNNDAGPPQKFIFGFGGGGRGGRFEGNQGHPREQSARGSHGNAGPSYGRGGPGRGSYGGYARDFHQNEHSFGRPAPPREPKFANAAERDAYFRNARREAYNGLMTNHEKAHLARVQVSQLMTDRPYDDDFYYAMFGGPSSQVTQTETSSETTKGTEMTWQQAMLVARSGGRGKGRTEKPKFHLDLSKMQEQASRWLAERKRKEKEGLRKEKGTDFSMEGALGKISSSTFKNPRHLLTVDGKIRQGDLRATTPEPHYGIQKPLRAAVLRYIEDAYDLLIELDVRKRQVGTEEDPADEAEWSIQTDRLADQLWERLRIQDEIAGAHGNGNVTFLDALGLDKGKRLLPRLFRHLNVDFALFLVAYIMSKLSQLDVVRPPAGGSASESHARTVDLFLASFVPGFVTFVSDLPFHLVIALMRILLEKGGGDEGLSAIAKSKVGLAVLTVLLSRAEVVKAVGDIQESELQLWSELYNALFMSIHNDLSVLFPDSSVAGVASEDSYVWQFLAALAVSASSVDYQRVLVMEVRERVLEAIRKADIESGGDAAIRERMLSDVNLFLRALGLDAGMVAGV